MKRQYYIISLILLMLTGLSVTGCNTARKAYNQGEYERAVRMSTDKLRSSPNNRRAREVLVKAWPMAVDLHLNRISTFERSNDPFRFEQMVNSYEQLNAMTERVQRCPRCLDLVTIDRIYIDELRETRLEAAEVRYQAGLAVLSPTNRERSREAYGHLLVVERMIPDYKDTRDRMEEALSYATLHVIVHVPPIQSRSLSVSHEFFHNKVLEYLQNNRRMSEMVRFYFPDEARAEGIDRPDHEVFLEFDEFAIGQTLMESNTSVVKSADSVKVGEVTLDSGEKLEVFNIVEARYTQNRKTLVSNGVMDLRIVDAWTGRVITQEKIPSEFVWVSEWASFNGDERALNANQRRLAGLREAPPPPPQDLFIAFTGPIYDQVTDRLRRFYAGYR
jgi:hypothetical protein